MWAGTERRKAKMLVPQAAEVCKGLALAPQEPKTVLIAPYHLQVFSVTWRAAVC